MILSFQNRFEEPIIKGTKIHTFRLDPHDRWKVGMPIQFYVGARTKQMRKFREDGECKHIMHVFISIQGSSALVFLRKWYSTDISERVRRINTFTFTRNDGFASAEDFIACIKQLHPGKEILTGKIIHWTDFRY